MQKAGFALSGLMCTENKYTMLISIYDWSLCVHLDPWSPLVSQL